MNRLILGESPAVQSLMKLIHQVADSKTNILIIGESGTGKELVARMIHSLGPLKTAPFVPVNCGAIAENLIESEMFGHKKGSFTGAVSDKAGLFEAANGGTLFLDEVGELPVGLQVKLLRAIQERVFRRVGSTEDIRVNVRIIAATNRDLQAAVAKGTFREDLYYRLNVILITTPPLRERKGDVKLLAQSFLKKFASQFQKQIMAFDKETMEILEAYKWPGNVRELENIIERAVTLETGTQVGIKDLPVAIVETVRSQSQSAHSIPASRVSAEGSDQKEIRIPAPNFAKGPINLDEILGHVERIYLTSALEQGGGVKKKAAELLGITFRSMRYRLNKLGVDGGDEE